MKTSVRLLFAACVAVAATACDAFHKLSGSPLKASQGAPYEVIVVCEQREWTGETGEALRNTLTAPIPNLNQTEPHFDVLRVRAQDFTGMIADHRNILKVVTDPSLDKITIGARYNVTATPQIVLTLQGPDDRTLAGYLAENGGKLTELLETAERTRDVEFAKKYGVPGIEKAIRQHFGAEMAVPKGYVLAAEQPDFIWARYEYPAASQGFFIYSYPYEGPASLSREALVAVRNKFAARIPGPSDGSYMVTADVVDPDYRVYEANGRTWYELRGFWDVANDYMGGPFVSFSTVDTARGRVFTLDCYVYSPKLRKRNFLRGVEHLLHTVEFPAPDAPGHEA